MRKYVREIMRTEGEREHLKPSRDEKVAEKTIVKALGRITIGSMMLGACGWEIGKHLIKAIKMAATGKMD